MKKACIAFPIGCPRNMLNAARLVDYLRVNKYEVIKNFRKADLLFVSTCGFNHDYEEFSIKHLGIANKEIKDDAKLIVFGCLTGINRERLIRDFNAIILDNLESGIIDKLIDSKINMSDIGIGYDLDKYRELIFQPKEDIELISLKNNKTLYCKELCKLKLKRTSKTTRKFLKYITNTNKFDSAENKIALKYCIERKIDVRISYGCMSSCAYCAIKNYAGQLTSIPINKILDTIKKGIADGYYTFSLVGEDVGAYGLDINSNIIKLLKSVFEIDNNIKIRFNDFSPKWLIEYFPKMKNILSKYQNNIQRFVLPVQSGSDKILNFMNREYNVKDFKKCINYLKTNIPNLNIETHILVGFPGETENDFFDTIELLKSIQFKEVQIYPYSDRQNTHSFNMTPKVSQKIINDRINQILSIKSKTNYIIEIPEQYNLVQA